MDGDRMQSERAAGPAGRADDRQSRPEPAPRRKRWPFLVFGLVLVVAAVGGSLYYLHARNYESTDDAFIDGDIAVVAPRVAGQVLQVAVTDNQLVHVGDLLVRIDPRDLQVKLDQAEAQRGNAAAQLEQARAELAMRQAAVDQAAADARANEADLSQAQQDFARYRAINPQAITRQQFDNASATVRSAQAKLDAKRQATAGAQAQVVSAQAQIGASQASLREADVNVANARLQLSYTDILAPVDGRVTKRGAVTGNYVTPGTALLSLVPRHVWVTANFKETQLAHMRPGQAVDVAVDAYPDVSFRGHVASFQAGTGSAFSTLPAENATGNYVKVVQRVPVKILLESPPDDIELSPGMSVVPSVTVR